MANFGELANTSIRLILLYLRNIATNLYRRLLIGLKYLGLIWQKRRQGKKFRSFGENIYLKFQAGDVNPLLQEDVKDQIVALLTFQENIAGRKAAMAQIKEQIKATSYRLAPPAAPPEPESQSDQPLD